MRFSHDLRVMSAPSRTYAQAIQARASGAWVGLRRPALVALVLAAGSTYGATGHVTLRLLVTGVVCWTFAVVIQIVTAAIIVRSDYSRPLPFARRLDLWFIGHGPWSLWICAVTALMANAPVGSRVEWPVIASAIVPLIWTTLIAVAFCRTVLGDPPNVAVARVAIHQAITWTIGLMYAGWAVALGPRIAEFLGR
jgi:hypothetical protein